MTVRIHYDGDSGTIRGYFPNSIPYASIPEPNVAVDESVYKDCIAHHGLRRVDLSTLQIVEYTPPEATTAELKLARKQALTTEYEEYRDSHRKAWFGATANKDSTTADAILDEIVALEGELKTRKETIDNE